MSDPLVSIIMPAKNEEQYLSECISSIINQSYRTWELIIIDDHSDDATFDIAEKYQSNDHRISAIKNQGHGITPALITGYDMSTGALITRMDADDIMPVDKLSIMVSALVNYPSHLITGKVKYFKKGGINDGYRKYQNWLNQLVKEKNHYHHIFKECVIPSPAWMVERYIFDEIGGFYSTQYPEDYDLAFRFYKGNVPIFPVDHIIHFWRDHETRASRNDQNYADNRFLELKVKYFLELEYKQKKLLLIGAGKKGKLIARILVAHRISFEWLTNNPKKIGHDIYGVILQDHKIVQSYSERANAIVALASPHDQLAFETLTSHINHITFYPFA